MRYNPNLCTLLPIAVLVNLKFHLVDMENCLPFANRYQPGNHLAIFGWEKVRSTSARGSSIIVQPRIRFTL
jgi:hypothetical protein